MEDEAVQLDGVIIVVFLRYKSVNLSHSTICVVMFVVKFSQLPAELKCPDL